MYKYLSVCGPVYSSLDRALEDMLTGVAVHAQCSVIDVDAVLHVRPHLVWVPSNHCREHDYSSSAPKINGRKVRKVFSGLKLKEKG